MTWPGEIALMRPVARIAQSVEQRIENPRVRGSIPRLGTIYNQASQQCEAFLLWASGRYLTARVIRIKGYIRDIYGHLAGCKAKILIAV